MVEARSYKPSEVNIEEQKPLTVELASKIFYNSYKHSQGSPELQRLIFRFIAHQQAQWSIDDFMKENIKNHITNALMTHSRGQNHNNSTSIKKALDDIDGMLGKMQRIFNNDEEKWSPSTTVSFITHQLIERERKYLLLSPTGRPRTSGNSSFTSMDPWFSFLSHHGFNGNPTGLSELDQMYADVSNFITEDVRGRKKLGPHEVGILYGIVDAHNAHHPQQQVTLF